MQNFLLGIIVTVLIVVAGYYYWTHRTPAPKPEPQQQGTQINVQVKQNGQALPPGTTMEDGTLPE